MSLSRTRWNAIRVAKKGTSMTLAPIATLLIMLHLASRIAPADTQAAGPPPAIAPAAPAPSIEVQAAIARSDAQHAAASAFLIESLLEANENLRLASAAKIAPNLRDPFAQRIVDTKRVWEFKTSAAKAKRISKLKDTLAALTAKSKVLAEGDAPRETFNLLTAGGPTYPDGVIGELVIDPNKILTAAETFESGTIALVAVRDAKTPDDRPRRFRFEGWDFSRTRLDAPVTVDGTVLVLAPDPAALRPPRGVSSETVYRVLKKSLWAEDPAFVASRKARAERFTKQRAEAERREGETRVK